MTGVLLVLALALVTGLPVAAALDRRGSRLRLAGEAMLFGLALQPASLMLLAFAGIRWSAASLALLPLVAAGVCAAIVVRRGKTETRERMPLEHPLAASIIVAGITALLAGYFLFATIAPMWENDFVSDWGMKGRAFYEARTIDWRVLETAVHHDAHPSYPVFLPLSFDAVALLGGGWDDRAIGALYVAWAAALLAIVCALGAAGSGSLAAGAAIALALVPIAASPWLGMGEGPLTACAGAGVLLLREAHRRDAVQGLTAAALLLGIGASFKNEGLVFFIAAALALAAAGRWRWIVRLWPALAVVLPWTLARSMHALPSLGRASGDEITRRLADPAGFLFAIAQPVGRPVYWIGIAAGIVIAGRALLRMERLVAVVVIVVMAGYVAAYVVSPFGLDRAKWGWERLISHITPLITFVVLVQLARLAGGQPDVSAGGVVRE